MGWSFGCTSKKQQVSELLAGTGGTRTRAVLKHSIRGNVLWTVEQIGPTPDYPDRNIRFIGCYLLSCHEGEWGYKGLEESMEPYYYTVPLAFFDLVTESEPGTKPEWRRDCIERQRIAKLVRLKQIPLGQVWHRRHSEHTFTVTGYHSPTQVLGYIDGDPNLYRVRHDTLECPVEASDDDGLCHGCGVYPSDDGGLCPGCEAYREHQSA